jgi:hypothetical protein
LKIFEKFIESAPIFFVVYGFFLKMFES